MLHKTAWTIGLSLLMAHSFSGCSATKTTNTSRSAVEQLLVSNAVDQSLNKVDFSPFSGHTVYLEDKYVARLLPFARLVNRKEHPLW